MFYYEKAKEQGWKPPTFTLKCKVVNTNIQFESVYCYTELINKILEIMDWNITTEIKVTQYDINMKEVDKTQEIIDDIYNIYRR